MLPKNEEIVEKSSWDFLSEREQEVLRLVAFGHTSAEIAEQLCLSVMILETYRDRGRGKLELRIQAARDYFAHLNGLISERRLVMVDAAFQR